MVFLVITKRQAYGLPISPDMAALVDRNGTLTPEAFGLKPEQLNLGRIEPGSREKSGGLMDMVGIVTTYEGDPLASGDIASRLGALPILTRWRRPTPQMAT